MIFTSRFPVLLTLAVAIAGVSAQQLDSCGQACVNTSIAAFCVSDNNITCLCTNTVFQDSLASCLSSNCSSADLAIATQLQNATCGNVSTSSTSATPSGTGNSATPSSSSSPSTKSNGATVEQLPLLTAIIAIAGTLMVGAFAL